MWLEKAYAVVRILMIIGIALAFFDGMETDWLLMTGVACITTLGLMALITVVIFFDDDDLGIVLLGLCSLLLLFPLVPMILGVDVNGEAAIFILLGGSGVVIWAFFSSLKGLAS